MFTSRFLRYNIVKTIRPRFGSSVKGDTAVPYAVKHKPTQPTEALAFGRKPGDPLEGWELITFGTLGICISLLVVGKGFSNNDNFQEWAKKEAVARETIKENGGEIEFGKFYSDRKEYASDAIDVMPVIKEE
mmetsp:Transcript_3724/g.3861  ORF Transcript_3724/g.3861 Transcript_3724/m.3861 type:complete len:132 (+) Transcript_3724:78-473(+)|eukprot:CAMPEP_0182416846 /NCGR_PEP_ID=MMETSP1167-20130531/1230_1 /TAXON_ID=2988 /ORGANISM="Mallomonas Sp, Strain CCMP3275" /LENGTH=131 /DNA_ID=CAMNT_0024589965 /DNA_START=73 /DNA_END=468 /DNA_ORIENTATION=+